MWRAGSVHYGEVTLLSVVLGSAMPADDRRPDFREAALTQNPPKSSSGPHGAGQRAQSLARNVVYNVSGQLCGLLLTFVAARFIFADLGHDAFAIVYLVITANAVLVAALDLGMSATIMRGVSAALIASERARLVQTASAGFWCAYGVGAAAVVMGSTWAASHLVHLEKLSVGAASAGLAIVWLGALTALPRALYASALRGLQRMAVPNVIDNTALAAQQGGAIVLIHAHADFVIVTLWMACTYLSATVAYAAMCGRAFGWGALVPRFHRDVLKTSSGFSARVFAVSTLQTCAQQGDKLIIGATVTASLFGLYAFATSVVLRASAIFIAVYIAALPALTSTLTQGRFADLRRQYIVVNDVQMMAAAAIFSAMPFANSLLLARVFGTSPSSDPTWLPVLLTSFAMFMQAAIGTLLTLALAHGTPAFVPRAFGIALICSLPIGWLCIRSFGIGGGGVTIAVFMVLQCALMVPRLSALYLRSSTFWFRSFGRLGLCWVGTLGVGMALQHGYHLGLTSTGLVYFVAAAAFVIATYRWVFHDETRNALNLVISRSTKRAPLDPDAKTRHASASMAEFSLGEAPSPQLQAIDARWEEPPPKPDAPDSPVR